MPGKSPPTVKLPCASVRADRSEPWLPAEAFADDVKALVPDFDELLQSTQEQEQ